MRNLIFGTLLSLFVAYPAMADYDFTLIGKIAAVQADGVVFELMDGKRINVTVTPMTEIEVEHRGVFEIDYHIPLSAIKVGEWAEIELFRGAYNNYYAKEINIVRH